VKALATNPVVILLLRLVIGGLFVVAAVPKIASPEQFAIAVDNYHFLPEALVNIWAIALPWIELVVGLLLIGGIWVEAAAMLSALMYLSFVIALSSALARGLDIACGCFDQGDEKAKIDFLYLIRDSSLLLGSIGVLLGYRGKLALEALWRKNEEN
jgi:uncharacterized membrane protein YphA (DoxX/SURF4 family)